MKVAPISVEGKAANFGGTSELVLEKGLSAISEGIFMLSGRAFSCTAISSILANETPEETPKYWGSAPAWRDSNPTLLARFGAALFNEDVVT